MKKELICIVCPLGCNICVELDNDYKVTGNRCVRGEKYGVKEVTNPTRTLTTTIKVVSSKYKRIPVKTDKEIPKDILFKCMKIINTVSIIPPIKMGEIIIGNILGKDVNIVATKTIR